MICHVACNRGTIGQIQKPRGLHSSSEMYSVLVVSVFFATPISSCVVSRND